MTTLRPTRRGDRRTERVTVRSLGPLGLAARQASPTVPGAVRVLPAFDARRHLPGKLARLRELDGRSSVRVRGQGTEFDALRDYVDGDDVRSIDWRATARRQAPRTARRPHLAARAGPAACCSCWTPAAPPPRGWATHPGSTPPWTPPCCSPRSPRGPATGSTCWRWTGGYGPGSRGRGPSLLPALVSAMAPLDADLVEADWSAIAGASSPAAGSARSWCC